MPSALGVGELTRQGDVVRGPGLVGQAGHPLAADVRHQAGAWALLLRPQHVHSVHFAAQSWPP